MKTKEKKIDLSTAIATASFVVSIGSLVWVGGFRMSELMHDVKDLKADVQKLENRVDEGFTSVDVRLEAIEAELHRHDIRINLLEQRKP